MVEDIRAAMRAGTGADIQRLWSRTPIRLLNPTQEYIGLSYDALDQLIPATLRRKHQLDLRLP